MRKIVQAFFHVHTKSNASVTIKRMSILKAQINITQYLIERNRQYRKCSQLRSQSTTRVSFQFLHFKSELKKGYSVIEVSILTFFPVYQICGNVNVPLALRKFQEICFPLQKQRKFKLSRSLFYHQPKRLSFFTFSELSGSPEIVSEKIQSKKTLPSRNTVSRRINMIVSPSRIMPFNLIEFVTKK